MKEIIERKEIQLGIQLIGLALAVAIPFAVNGARIDQLEKQVAEDKISTKEITIALQDIQVRIATVQKDIEFIKLQK